MKTITFNELRKIKDSLPTGSIHRIADELGMSVETIRNFFGGHNFKQGESVGIHLEPGPDGGLVMLDDTTVLEKALEKHVSSSIKEAIKILNDTEKELLDVIIEESKKIKNNEVLTSTRVFKKLTKNKKNSYSKLKRTLERLEFLRLIDTSLSGKGVRGKTTQIYLRFNPEDLE